MQDKEIKIIQLSDRDAVRTRTGMYFSSTENANIALREIVDNAIDEVLNSNCNTVHLNTNYPDGWRMVCDYGRGMPFSMTTDAYGNEVTQAELAWFHTHSGSKFSKDSDSVAVGQNGTGSAGVNFTSSNFYGIAKTNDPDIYYLISAKKGIKDKEIFSISRRDIIKMLLDEHNIEFNIPKGTSTCVIFQPDDEIWQNVESEYNLQNLKYTTAVLDKFYKKKLNFYLNNELQTAIYEPKKFEFMTQCKVGERLAKFYITFDISSDLSFTEYTGSVNSLRVPMGLHMNAARDAYTKALKSLYNIQHDNIRNGLSMDIICVAGEVDFSSQVKQNCTKIEGLTITDLVKSLEPEFRRIIKSNPDVFDLHVERLNTYAESLSKISAIQKVKNLINTVGGNSNKVRSKLPKSIKDCTTSKRSDAELFICEGKSASGNILRTRDPKTQSVFELRGVTLNSVGLDLDTIMENEECKSIITAIGGGVDAYHNKNSVRYGKVIITADGDSDGRGHIAPLVLGLIGAQMKYLIDMGCVYVLDSPLYKQDGKYFYLDNLSDLDKSKPLKRFKGLGELTQQEAYDTITNRSTRKLIQITNDNLKDALALLNNSYIRKQLMVNKGQLIDKYNTGII